jgi:uncharacterized membrane protein
MNVIFDVIIILVLKLILLIGFVLLIKYWLKKKNNIIPIFLYWILGLFFVFTLSSQIIEWFLMQFYYNENSLVRSAESTGSLAAIIGLITYIFIGAKYIKRKKIVK